MPEAKPQTATATLELARTRHGRNPQTGKEIKIAAKNISSTSSGDGIYADAEGNFARLDEGVTVPSLALEEQFKEFVKREEGELDRDRIAEAEKAERCSNGIDNDCDGPIDDEPATAVEALDYNSSRSNKQGAADVTDDMDDTDDTDDADA